MTSFKHALVTGGSSGIGRAIALDFAKAGMEVTICGRREVELAKVAALSPNIHPLAADVTDETSVEALYRTAEEARGPFDVVVANAGIASSSPAHRTTLEEWNRIITTNLTGAFLTVRPALKGMADRKAGRIIFIASVAGLRGSAYVAPYVSSKHGVVGLTRALAAELLMTGVTVNAICPGYVETEMLEQSIQRVMEKTGRSEEEARRGFAEINPNHRLIKPEEVSAATLWLVSDAAISVTGQAIPISGGQVMVSAPLEMFDEQAPSKERLRLWIRLLRAARIVEGELRERLKREYQSTLPRFDVMAALFRQPDGMLMSDLSRFLLVSNGNVTGIVDRLVTDGLVVRSYRDGDRRTSIVRLTDKGEESFRTMAAAHEGWIAELLGDVGEAEARKLSSMLKSFRSNWEDET